MIHTSLSEPKSLEQSFLQSFENRPHHAWILKGPKGIGKLSFAKKIASKLLVEITSDDHIERKIENQNHPGFLYIAPDQEKSKTISIDQIREIVQFLNQTSPDGGWKVIILDSLNNLTDQGSNGLLKILESPPSRTVFFLIQHHGTMPLATIVSRCAQLSFPPLSNEQLSNLLPADLSEANKSLLLGLARGCPNYLQNLIDQDVLNLYESFETALRDLLERTDYIKAHNLAQTVVKNPFHAETFLFLIEWWLQNAIKEKTLGQYKFLKTDTSLSTLLDIHERVSKIMRWKKDLDLDNRQLVLNIFLELKSLKV